MSGGFGESIFFHGCGILKAMIGLLKAPLSLLLAGGMLFPTGRVQKGVVIEGIAVGGQKYEVAEQVVREKIKSELAPLTVHTPEGDVSFSLQFQDDLHELVRRAKKGESLSVEVKREWVTMEEDIAALCAKNARLAQDAEVTFSSAGFTYQAEKAGVYCDYDKALALAEEGLKSGEFTLPVGEYLPSVTEKILRERTRLLARFTTYFDAGNTARAGNIALAASRIAGTVLEAGEEFSFNGTVGARTVENGFGEASVILEGKFVPGVGGGVCQASTTLMNAALRAGLEVTESRPHSLSVGYVPPSLDAMVSSSSDLRFRNPYPFPVYINARTQGGSVTFLVYGMRDGKKYETESHVLYRIAPPPATEVESEPCDAKEGLVSESYLLVYDESGKLLSRKLFRRDKYAPVQERKIKEEPQPSPTT